MQGSDKPGAGAKPYKAGDAPKELVIHRRVMAMRSHQRPARAFAGYGTPPKSLVADFQAALLNTPYQGISVHHVNPSLSAQIDRYLTVLWTVGAVLMTPATWVMVWHTMRCILQRRFRNETVCEAKSQLVTIDGRLIDLLMTSAQTEAGITRAALVELTDLVRAREALARPQIEFAHAARVSTLGELTASIAHELNQPLGAIAVNCEASLRWLQRPQPNLDEVHELTKRSLADARRAAEIIDHVRGMAVHRAPERALVPLHDVIQEALQFLRHEVGWRGITVSHVLSAASSNVLADRTLLHQLIVNLCVNAMQAMAQIGEAERRITVRTESPDGTVLRCSVEDSGPGIELHHLSRLFESFFTTKRGGMGMGLSICRSIIEAHGGEIEADNGSVHGGARFSFTLPVAE
jgi:C4-dicarboxylate-specific signal transduction histidine kinase